MTNQEDKFIKELDLIISRVLYTYPRPPGLRLVVEHGGLDDLTQLFWGNAKLPFYIMPRQAWNEYLNHLETRSKPLDGPLVGNINAFFGIDIEIRDLTVAAYDGSQGKPIRDLTALERDILVRVINDIIVHARREPPMWNDEVPFPGWHWSPVPIRIGEDDFFEKLVSIRSAIDPRRNDGSEQH